MLGSHPPFGYKKSIPEIVRMLNKQKIITPSHQMQVCYKNYVSVNIAVEKFREIKDELQHSSDQLESRWNHLTVRQKDLKVENREQSKYRFTGV